MHARMYAHTHTRTIHEESQYDFTQNVIPIKAHNM